MSQEQAKQFLEQATQSVQSGQFDQALELVDQSIELNPNDTEAFVLRGICLSQTNRPQEATEAFRKAILLSAYNPKAYFNLAVHQYSQGNKIEALEMAREAARIDPRHAGARDLIKQVENELTANVSAVQPKADAPTNLADPLAPPPGGGEDRPASAAPTPSAQPAVPSVQPLAPSQPSYSAPPGYRDGYSQPAHSLPFVERMGGAWTGIAWAIAALNAVAAIVMVALMGNVFSEAMSNPSRFQGPEGQAMIRDQIGTLGQAVVLGSYGLLILGLVWVILDIIDRRGNWIWLVPFVICAIPCACAPYLGPMTLLLPIYLLAARK